MRKKQLEKIKNSGNSVNYVWHNRRVSGRTRKNRAPAGKDVNTTEHSDVHGFQQIIQNSTVSPQAISMAGNPITSHVLDTASGKPAANLKMSLHRMEGAEWKEISSKVTNNDGRASGFLTQAEFTAGIYKMFFDTGDYYKQQSSKGFYPKVEIHFEIEFPEEHYHIPLLLSPYGYTTYRGS